MKQMSSRTVQYVSKYIREKYGFMLESGYQVVSMEDIPGGWQALFRKPELVVRIFRVKGEDDVAFQTGALPPDEFFDIGSVVYAATGEIIPLSSYDDLSQDLQKYIGRIETYFQGKPVNLQDSLRAAQREYRAAINPAGAASPAFKPPEEPRKIPFLYYPLLGIVLVLIFGALTTLYAVLLEQLFLAFSLDPDSYDIFRLAGAVLLALGTMLIFRVRRQKG